MKSISRKKVRAVDILAPKNRVLVFNKDIWKSYILWVLRRNIYLRGLLGSRKKRKSQRFQKSKRIFLVAKCWKTCFRVSWKEKTKYFLFFRWSTIFRSNFVTLSFEARFLALRKYLLSNSILCINSLFGSSRESQESKENVSRLILVKFSSENIC